MVLTIGAVVVLAALVMVAIRPLRHGHGFRATVAAGAGEAARHRADAGEAFREYLAIRMRQPLFANARSVRNELERARLRHAHRLATDQERRWGRDDLMRLEPEDIRTGRAFPAPAASS